MERPIYDEYFSPSFGVQLTGEFAKDIWEGEKIGVDIKPNDKKILNFTKITQLELRYWAKQCLYHFFQRCTWGTCDAKLDAIVSFSRFLAEVRPDYYRLEDITNEVIVQYINYMNFKGWTVATKHDRISRLKVSFDLSEDMRWWTPPDIQKIYYPRKNRKAKPKYIPEFVLKQLLENLCYLPEPVARMVIILLESGMRISELVTLKPDCIEQDTKGTGG